MVNHQRIVSIVGATAAVLGVTWTSASGQWLNHKTRSIPRDANGKPNLPHSEDMRLTERFRRQDVGHMDIGMVVNDPKAYTRPLTYVQPQVLLPDTDLLEYVCAENAKPIGGVR